MPPEFRKGVGNIEHTLSRIYGYAQMRGTNINLINSQSAKQFSSPFYTFISLVRVISASR